MKKERCEKAREMQSRTHQEKKKAEDKGGDVGEKGAAYGVHVRVRI